MYCAVRISGDIPNPRTGLLVPGVIGTGFFVGVPGETNPALRHSYLLTANHVVEDQSNVEVQVADPTTGVLSEPLSVRDWRQPFEQVDLAIASIPRGFTRRLAIPLNQVLPDDKTLTPGSLIYYLGQFTPFDRVMARSGTIGAVDQEGLPGPGRRRRRYGCSNHPGSESGRAGRTRLILSPADSHDALTRRRQAWP